MALFEPIELINKLSMLAFKKCSILNGPRSVATSEHADDVTQLAHVQKGCRVVYLRLAQLAKLISTTTVDKALTRESKRMILSQSETHYLFLRFFRVA